MNVTPHTFAMGLLHGGVDTATMVLWLGHAYTQTTQGKVDEDLERNRRILGRVASHNERQSDAFLAFLANR